MHSPILIAAVGRVLRLDKQDRPFQIRVVVFGLALVLGFMLGAFIVHLPPLYLFLGIGGVVFAFLVLFKIEIAILLAILLRNELGQFNYLGGDTAMHPNGLMGVAIIAGAGFFFVMNRIDVSRLRAFWPFLVFSVVTFLSLLWAGEYLMDGLTVALRLLTALAVYAVLVYKLDSIKKINWLICAIIAAQILPTVQGLLSVAQGGGMDLESAEIVRSGHSGQGAFLAMILAFCLVQFLDASTALRRVLWGSLTSFFAVGLFFSYGRAGWIGFSVTALVIGLMKRSKLLIAFPIVLVLLITLVPTVAERFADIDLNRLDDGHSSTLAGRIEVWRASAEIYQTHPWLGVGYGVIRYRVGEYLGGSAPMAHNDYLAVLVQTGLIGLLVFLLWHGKWFAELLEVRRTTRHAYDKTLALAVFAMFIASLVVRVTDNVLETTEKLYPLVALVAATLALPRIRAKDEAEDLARVLPEDDVMADMAATRSSESLDRQVRLEDEQRPEPLSAAVAMSAGISPTDVQRGDPPGAVVSGEKRSDLLTVARGGSLVFAGNVATRGMNYVYSAVLIWGLGAESFGLFTLALFIATLVGVVANLGLDLGILRYGAIHAHTEGQAGIHRATVAALRVVLPASLLLTLALWLAAGPIASGIFDKPLVAPLVRALALSIPFMTVQSSLMAATRALKIMRYSVAVSVIQPLAALILAIGLMATGFGINEVALSLVASWIVGAGLALFFYFRLMPRVVRGGARYPLRQMLKFSLPLSFTKWIEFANERTEIFFLGLLPGAVDIGIYNVAWRLAVTETIFRQSLEQIVAPFGSDLSHRRQIKELEALYKTTAKWSLTGALPLFLIFWLFGPTIMGVFDPAYVAASSVLLVLGFAQLVNASTGPCGMLLIMSGRSDLSLLNIVVLFTTSIGLDWLLIPQHGLAGAAVAGAVSILLVTLLRVTEVWLTLKIQPFKWSAAKPIAAGLVSAALVQGLRRLIPVESLGTEIIACLLMLASYVAIIYLLRLDAEDMLVIGAVKRKFGGLTLRERKG